MIDSHVHFWDPDRLTYPWLDAVPALRRRFDVHDYNRATRPGVDQIVFVECNCAPEQNLAEVAYITELSKSDPRISAIVAFVDLTEPNAARHHLELLVANPLVRGIRHNIQGQPPGFSLQEVFVRGVRAVGEHDFTFDLCITYDQVPEAIELVHACPDTTFVLDHSAKPPIKAGQLEPWRAQLAELARFDNVVCKVSGLLTEADHEEWRARDLLPYAQHGVDVFGVDRVLFGSDWPVLTLAGEYSEWLEFTESLTGSWSDSERRRFYHDNAAEVYRL